MSAEQPRFSEERYAEIVNNIIMSRSQFLKQYFDPRRDIDKECGYPDTKEITADLCREMYDREPIGTRVVEVLPKESWQVQPEVYEDADPSVSTAFEEALSKVGNSLKGTSWHEQEEGNPIWEHLLRADIMSGVGHYGVILFGIDDGKPLHEPVEGIDPKTGKSAGYSAPKRKLLFIRTFDESLAQITQYETDTTSPRYGQPTVYNLTFSDPNATIKGGIGANLTTQSVHWTRVVHIADNLNCSEIVGIPRQRPVWNRLLDLRKLYAGSAEMYWRGAFPGLSVETHPQLGGDVDVDKKALRETIYDYQNGLQRHLALMGMTAKSLAPQVVDPTPQIDSQLTAICIVLGIPKRVFLGSERGELASGQDDQAWNDRLRFRQAIYITPRIIAPVIDRLIAMGVLPTPKSYTVSWPDLTSLSESDRADIAVKRTQALTTFIQGGGEAMLTPMDFYTHFLRLSQYDAKAIVEALRAMSSGEDDNHDTESPLLKMVGGISALTALFQLAGEGKVSDEQVKEILKRFYKLDNAEAEALIADGFPEPPAPVGNPTGQKPPITGQAQPKPKTNE